MGSSFRTVDGLFEGDGALTGGVARSVRVGGRGGVDGSAVAVSLNVAVVDPRGGGFLTVWPRSVSRGCLDLPLASVVNFGFGQTVANAFTVPVGAGGEVCVYSSQSTDVIADVLGYEPTSSAFEALSPVRLLETRVGSSFRTVDGLFEGDGALTGGVARSVRVGGRGGVDGSAVAVSLNVAVVDPRGGGFLTVWPRSVSRGCLDLPLASVVNFGFGQTVANAFTVPVGAGGEVCVYSSQSTDVIADVLGFYPGN